VARYSNEFKERAVARLVPPESAEITRLSQEIGVSVRHTRNWNPITVVTLNPERDSLITAAQNATAETRTAA
jgi:transposase